MQPPSEVLLEFCGERTDHTNRTSAGVFHPIGSKQKGLNYNSTDDHGCKCVIPITSSRGHKLYQTEHFKSVKKKKKGITNLAKQTKPRIRITSTLIMMKAVLKL